MIPLALLALWGCHAERYQRVELQLDIRDPVPEGATTVRVCVAGVGQRSVGARQDGRLSFVAIPAGAPVDVRVDVLDAEGALLGQAWAPALDGYAAVDLDNCADSGSAECVLCRADGQLAAPGEAAWTLGVRFGANF